MGREVIEQRKTKTNNTMFVYELSRFQGSYSLAVSCSKFHAGVDNYTVNESFALFIFEKLVEGAVHPYHLQEILEDFLTEYDPVKHYGESYEEEFRRSQGSQNKVKA